jgi:hypothetical protein
LAPIEGQWVRAELDAIHGERNANRKGQRLEALVRHVFCEIPGISIEDQDVVNAYRTQEMDLFFWNIRERDGLHFLDCPLIIECKGWSRAVSGRELRQFATLLRDRGRQNGIFIALNGITGDPHAVSAGFYHLTAALAGGQLVLVITGDDLAGACDSPSLIALLQRRMLDQVKGQVLRIGTTRQRTNSRSVAGRTGAKRPKSRPKN